MSRIDREWCKRKKVIRSVIRLQYSIMADDDINDTLEAEYKKFYKAVQDGKTLPPFDPEKFLGR